MKSNLTIDPFSLAGAALHVAPGGETALIPGNELESRLADMTEGLLFGAFELALASDVHPDTWEMHPAGDEVLVMLSGALDVETANGARRIRSSLRAGQGVVMPRGVWHRLDLLEPGLLLTLTPLQGTRHGSAPECRP